MNAPTHRNSRPSCRGGQLLDYRGTSAQRYVGSKLGYRSHLVPDDARYRKAVCPQVVRVMCVCVSGEPGETPLVRPEYKRWSDDPGTKDIWTSQV